MANPAHVKAIRDGVDAWNGEHIGSLIDPDLQGADLRQLALQKVYLFGVNLRSANLEQTDLSQANIIRADFSGAILTGAKLSGAKLIESNASNANFRKANLQAANLQASNFQGANFQNANLREADLVGANLFQADLRGANLQRSDLSFCVGLGQDQIEQALGDIKTKLPEGLRYPSHWLARDADKTGSKTESHPESISPEISFLPSPVLLAWSGTKIVVASPPEQIPAFVVPAVREQIINAQIAVASMLAESIAETNADQRLSKYLSRYAEQTDLPRDKINILHLDTLFRSLQAYFKSNAPAIAEIDESGLGAFFDNHKALRETYPEWHEFYSLLRHSHIHQASGMLASELRQAVSDSAAADVLDSEARKQIQEETDQPDAMADSSPNKAKVLGVAAIIILLWRLLSQAPQAIKNFEALEALAKKIKPLVDALRSSWSNFSA